MKLFSKFLFIALFASAGVHLGSYSASADLVVPPEEAQSRFISIARKIDGSVIAALPVQHNGRIKPLDSYARETLVFVTGKYGMWGLSPLQIYLGMMISDQSTMLPLIDVRDPKLRNELNLPPGRRFYSQMELQTSELERMARTLAPKEEKNSKSLNEREKKIIETYQQLLVSRAISNGGHFFQGIDLTFGKHGADPSASASLEPVQQAAALYFRALGQEDPIQSKMAARDLISIINAFPIPEMMRPYRDHVRLEVLYNKLQPFLIAAIAYILIAILLLIPQTRAYLGKKGIIGFLAVPVLIHGAGFALRVYITRFAPVTNMYGTMLWVAFGVALFSAVLYVFYQQAIVVGFLLATSGLVLLLTHSLPLILSPDMDPIVAVLRSNFWLSTHVLTITISYAAFTVAMVLGNVGLVANIFGVKDRDFYERYAHFTYRMIQLGVFLISGGIILGGIWADYSWGRFWGWDPKETWALIADIGFLMILHARFVGWLRDFGVLACATVAYLLVIMAWYGVNFILAAGLHSYGFSSGGATAVIIFVSLQAILLATSLAVHRGNSGSPRVKPKPARA